MEQKEAAEALLEPLALKGRLLPDHLLALSSAETDPAERLQRLNAALQLSGLPRLHCPPGPGAALDRLAPASALPPRPGGMTVSVVLAVAPGTPVEAIGASLAALASQDWPEIEIVLAAPQGASLPALPTELRPLEAPAGTSWGELANLGLARARGSLVTLLRAGDGMHPRRISRQAEHLMAHRQVQACTAPAVYLTPTLEARIWCGPRGVGLVRDDPETLMFRRAAVLAALGARDTVPEAGAEFAARIEQHFGPNGLTRPAFGPLVFLRDAPRPAAISESRWGRLDPARQGPLPHGALRNYHEAWRHHHKHGPLHYAGQAAARPFPVPPRLTGQGRTHFDVILASDFRLIGGSTQSNAAELVAQKRAGLTTGLFQMYRYDFYARPERDMLPEVRREIDGDLVQLVDESCEISSDLLVLRYPSIIENLHAHLPRIRAATVKVIVNQPPMSDYTGQGRVRYGLARADAHARQMFGRRPVWHPIGPLVREALHRHHADELGGIDLAPDDWLNIIDLAGWSRPVRQPDPARRPRIGRHSRDHKVKWPDRAEDILAAYPDDGSFEVHVLGGAQAPGNVLGHQPERWHVHEFGAVRPQTFLRDLDFWVYFAHPNWVESFGRTIIEAMAVGVPVILPEIYRPLFGEHAIYGRPQDVAGIVTRLWNDPDAYHRHATQAQAHVRDTYSYEMHADRIRRAMKEAG